MKFLIDVNLSKSKKFLKDHPNLINVKDEINGKVSDKRLIKIAKKRGYGLYTQDKRCALDALVVSLSLDPENKSKLKTEKAFDKIKELDRFQRFLKE